MTPATEVRAVSGRGAMRDFLAVPFRQESPAGLPRVHPLRRMTAEALHPGRDPFWRHAARELFVARRGGRPVGRIAAIHNARHNEDRGDRVGFFGFYEADAAPDTTAQLVEAAELWLQRRGLDRIRGPVNPSMNHECGLLVDGFEHPPRILTPWNPPRYAEQIEDVGFTGAMDLIGYDLPIEHGERVETRMGAIIERLRSRVGVRFELLDPVRVEESADILLDLYNGAWEGNWGFVPVDREEWRHIARELKPLFLPQLCLLAVAGGEPVAFMLVVRDLNELLRHTRSGRLGPLTILRLIRGLPRLRTGRLIALGVDPAHRRSGVLNLLLWELVQRAREIGGERGEASWILDDNAALRGPIESLGLEPYRRWRIYEKEIDR